MAAIVSKRDRNDIDAIIDAIIAEIAARRTYGVRHEEAGGKNVHILAWSNASRSWSLWAPWAVDAARTDGLIALDANQIAVVGPTRTVMETIVDEYQDRLTVLPLYYGSCEAKAR